MGLTDIIDEQNEKITHIQIETSNMIRQQNKKINSMSIDAKRVNCIDKLLTKVSRDMTVVKNNIIKLNRKQEKLSQDCKRSLILAKEYGRLDKRTKNKIDIFINLQETRLSEQQKIISQIVTTQRKLEKDIQRLINS